MKVTHRIFSMILCVVMLVTMSLTATVSASGDGIMYDLTSLGITGGFGFEDHLDSNITRAEFAQLVVNMMNHKDIAKSMESASYFSDVANSPYKGAINLLYKEEIVSGTGAGTFDPNRNVRYTEACKMLVKALGYHVIVSDTSLDSYTFLAGTIGVTENVDTSKEYITVRDMLVMVNNCLDIDRMVPMYYNDNIAPSYVVDEGNRFRYDFEKPTPNGTVKMEGLVTGDITSYMYTERDSLKDTQLVISVDGFEKVYDFDGVAPTGFVGKRVYFYITVDADGNYGKITSLAATNKNTVASVLGTDLKSYSKNGMEFYISEKQTAKIETSIATKWLYNGAPGSYCLDTVDLDGNVQLVVIDNNDDEIFDVVSVFEYTDTIVERIDKEAKTIIFENGYYYKNEKNMCFDEDEEEITVTYFDAEGKVSNFEAIAEGDVLSIARSKSGRQLRVVISKRSGTALLEGKDGEFVTLGIEEFKVLGVNPAALKPGRNYDYKVNFMGRLVYAEEVIVTSSYAYTYKLSGATGFNTPKIQLIMPSKVESKKILDENGEDTQDESSYIRNSNLLVYNVADKVILESWVVDEDGNYSLDKKKVTANAQNLASHMDQPVSYEVDENNNIIKLSKLKPHAISVSMTYVGGEKVFAGSKSVRPFGLSENTYAMCIPTNDVTEDEILNHIQELQTNLPFEISAYEVDEDTHMVGLIVDKRAMYTESDNVLSAIIRRYFGMVTKARKVYDKETQTESIKISMYTRGTDNTMSEKTFVVSQFADNYEEFSKVNKGDLIRYGLDGFDRMIASKVVQSFESYYDGSNGYQNEDYTVCGTVTDIDYDEISNEKMGWVHVLKLENIDGPQTVELYKNEDSAPQVFILNSADRSSKMGTVEDIRYGDRILIYSNNGTIYSVVLYR